jgi:hypothetical protein
MDYPKQCTICKRDLFGPVSFCPFCGTSEPFAEKPDIPKQTVVGEEIKQPEIKPLDVEVQVPVESTSPPVMVTVRAVPSKNGGISPASQTVVAGSSLTFSITPDQGYRIDDVRIDGKSVGAQSSYTFAAIAEDHTIEAIFSPCEFMVVYRKDGVIHERFNVEHGSDKLITIVPAPGFSIKDVTVDGVSQGPVDSYRFTDIKTDHDITVEFNAIKSKNPLRWVFAAMACAMVLVVSFWLLSKKGESGPTARLSISTNPSSARVLIDGALIARPGAESVELKPGLHEITAGEQGYKDESLSVTLKDGEIQRVSIHLSKNESASVARPVPASAPMPQPTTSLKPQSPPAMKPVPEPVRKPLTVSGRVPTSSSPPADREADDFNIIADKINKGISLYDQKKYPACIATMESVLRKVPNNTVARRYLEMAREAQAGK